jgi:sugar phosphate isomerase/epimerase
MWQTLGQRYAPSAHIKDVIVEPDLVVHISEAPPGQGMLDLDAFFEVVRNLGEGSAVIVEHLPEDQARAAIQVVKAAAAQRDFTFG